jgi:hypothetical protein
VACSFTHITTTTPSYYEGSCVVPNTGVVGNWKVCAQTAFATQVVVSFTDPRRFPPAQLTITLVESGVGTVVYVNEEIPSYCPSGTFARVTAKQVNKIRSIRNSLLGETDSRWLDLIRKDEFYDCKDCNDFPGLRCGTRGINNEVLSYDQRQLDAGLTTYTIQLLPDYWRAYLWSEDIKACAEGFGCNGNVTQIENDCGLTECSRDSLYTHMVPYSPEEEGMYTTFTTKNPQMATCTTEGDSEYSCCPGCFAYNDAYCRKGFTGPVCQVCARNWYPSSGDCFKCPEDVSGSMAQMAPAFVGLGVALCVGGTVAALILNRKKKRSEEKRQLEERNTGSGKSLDHFEKEGKRHDNALKVLVKENKLKVFMLVVTFQVLYQFHQVTSAAAKQTPEPDKSYPSPADKIVNSLSVFNFEFLQYIPPACVRPGANFHTGSRMSQPPPPPSTRPPPPRLG